ncbi:MAG: hypothetical protein K2Q20_02605 [Phycisphaerales bacterium]|nr:hypothetical protein [Phycisphaerales bacterium]
MLDQLEWYQTRKEKHAGSFLKKLERYASEGFSVFVGDGKPIRLEWDQVYRIGEKSSLFRLVGFHVGNYSEFIAIDAYLKSDTKLNASERHRIDSVAAIRARGGWYRVDEV